MNFNLKNRPNISGYKCVACQSYREWLQGFEKELHDILEKSELHSKLLKLKEQFIIGTDTKEERFMEQAYRLAIKEILGEA